MNIAILALVSLFITLPSFFSNSLIFSQDILFHFVWSEQFYKALMEGVLYPRWVDTPFGYGTPTFIFYAPLSFYVISAINVLTKSQILSVNIAIYLSFFLSGLSMYFFSKNINGQRAGLISGALYQLFPYHILDLFSRGVLPELSAFIWFPLILLLMQKIFTDRKSSSIVFLSFAYAGLTMTHLVSSFMFTFVMIGYGLYLSFTEKKSGTFRMFCAMALGIGLSSIYLMPVIFERGFTHMEFIKFFNYKDCFLFLKGNLGEGLFYPILHGIVIFEIAFLILSFWIIRRKLTNANNSFFVFLLFASLFLTTPLSILIWRYIPEFSNLQFPWRWLIFSGLSVSIIAGNLIGNFKGEVQKATSILVSPLLIMSIFLILHVSFFKSGEINYWRSHSGLFSPVEYRPLWLKDFKKVLPAAERVSILNGNGSVDIGDWKSNQRLLSTNSKTSLMLKFSTFYYPGWIAKIDYKQSDIIIEKDTGSMLLEVPEGRHKIELIFKDTPVRYYAKVISLISLIVVLSLYLYGMFKPANKSLIL